MSPKNDLSELVCVPAFGVSAQESTPIKNGCMIIINIFNLESISVCRVILITSLQFYTDTSCEWAVTHLAAGEAPLCPSDGCVLFAVNCVRSARAVSESLQQNGDVRKRRWVFIKITPPLSRNFFFFFLSFFFFSLFYLFPQ